MSAFLPRSVSAAAGFGDSSHELSRATLYALYAVVLALLILVVATEAGAELLTLLPGRQATTVVSFDLQDADIHSALRIFSETSRLNIVASRDVMGKAKPFRVHDVTLAKAFELFLQLNDLVAEEVEGVVVVYTLSGYTSAAHSALNR